MVVIGKRWLYLGKVLLLGQKWLFSGKVVVFGQGGCIHAEVVCINSKWFYSCKSGCFRGKKVLYSGKSLLYSGKSGCIRAEWLRANSDYDVTESYPE